VEVVMKNILQAFETLGNIFLDGKEESDPTSSVATKNATFFAMKQNTRDLNGSTIESKHGSVFLPEGFYSEEQCLESTVSGVCWNKSFF
jgi:hypothetical protein